MAPLDAEVVQRKLEHLRELRQMLEAEAGATASCMTTNAWIPGESMPRWAQR